MTAVKGDRMPNIPRCNGETWDTTRANIARMKVCLAVFVAMLGCGFPRPADLSFDAPTTDASAVDAPIAPVCFGNLVPICFPASMVPSTPRTLLTVEIDTDMTGASSLCDQNNDQKAAYCVVVGAGVSLP